MRDAGLRIEVKITGASTYYLNLTTGAWSTTSTDANISYAAIQHKYGTIDFETGIVPGDGTLTVTLTAATRTGVADTYFKLSLTPTSVGPTGAYTSLSPRNFTETIDADSLEDSDQITYYFGDVIDEDGKDVLLGSMKLLSGTETSEWYSSNGSVTDTLVGLSRDCYQVQYETAARRIQAQLKGQLNYLSVITDADDRRYLATSIKRNFADSTLDGEWIEIKRGWGADIMGTMTNSVGRPYDIFGTSQGYVTATKSQTLAEASVQLGSTAATAGVLYKINLTVSSSTGVMPELIFAGTTTAIALGVNVLYVKATSTASTHATFFTNQGTGDVAAFTITGITIKEAIGI